MTAATALLQVLLVEDDLRDVSLMQSSFAEHQAPTELHHVADGAEALTFLRHEDGYADAPRPDLILLDLNMPRVDGRHVLSTIKADEQLKAIPVVVTTSATPADIVSSYGAHANAYVTRPIDLDEFDRVVAQIRNFYGHTVALPRRPSCDANRHDGSAGDPTNSTPPA